MSHDFTDQEWAELLIEAGQLGYAHGRRDGAGAEITDIDHARRLLSAITGDPIDGVTLSAEEQDQITDSLLRNPLSGEYADDMTPDTLYEQLGVHAENDTDDMQLCHTYDEGYGKGQDAVVVERCRAALGLPRFELVPSGATGKRSMIVRFDGHTDVVLFVRDDGSLGVQIDPPGGGFENQHGLVGYVVMFNDADLYRNPHLPDSDTE